MAMTENARNFLGARIIEHKEERHGKTEPRGKTATGLMHKGGNVFVIPPSQETTATHTGALAQLTEDERRITGLDEPTPAPEQPAKPAAKRSRSRAKASEPQAPQAVRVELLVPGVGSLPAQYAHCYEGKGVLVLGLNDMSYVPSIASRNEDGTIRGEIALASRPDTHYVFVGNEFKDNNGIRNLILVEVPKE